jgi:hemoglobin-like flavoprotein
MNEQTIALVRTSWSHVQRIAPVAADLFYRHLFADAPELRPLFRGDLKLQGDKLMQMLDWLVASLEDWPALSSGLVDLGRRHAAYGVRASHYDRVGAALLRTLADGLGAHFTPATECAWAETYQLIADTMIAAANEKRSEVA